MNRILKLHKGRMLTLLCCGLLASGSVFADKSSGSGGANGYKDGKGHGNSESNKSGRQEDHRGNDGRYSASESNRNRDDRRDHNDRGYYRGSGDHRDDQDRHERDRTYSSRNFDAQRRSRIHDYYSSRKHSGRCPPGLAKRGNGCVAPGHERRWAVGQRLPRDVIFYNLEPQVITLLGPPPPRHRFVRVASDILLIAIGTGMVIDAIDDLDRD